MNMILDWRDRLIARPDFQRWSAKFALTRPVARREARALFDICAGFVYAQVLAACVELDLFALVAARPLRVEALALRCAVPEPAMRMLVEAAASLRLLALRRGTVRLGMLGAALQGNPGVAAMVAHHRLFYADLADPVALLRGDVETRLGRFWPRSGQGGDASAYSALMAATQPMITAQILDAYNAAQHRVIMDVGGGDGAFLQAVAKRAPHSRLRLFDLPAVAAQAEARFARAGLNQATVFSGNFCDDALPKGADLITLVRVLHDHDDAQALTLLRAVRQAMAPGGTLLLAEPMSGAAGAAPVGAAYFGFYLLAMGSGRTRSAAEIEVMLAEAGFWRTRQIRTNQPMLAGLIAAFT